MSHHPDERDNPYEPVEPPEGRDAERPGDAPGTGDGTADLADRPADPGPPTYADDAELHPADAPGTGDGTADLADRPADPGPPTYAADADPADTGPRTFADDVHVRPADDGPPTDTPRDEPPRVDTAAQADGSARPDRTVGDDERDIEDTWTDTAPVSPSEDASAAPTTRVSTTDPDAAVTSTFDVREAERRQPGGVHGADRPVPRSGLAEYHSAGFLTGERRPTDEDAATDTRTDDDTSPAWLGAAGAGAEPDAGAAPESADERTDRTRRDVVLDGSTALTRPPSRGGAHVLTVLVTLLLTPVAWYLLADAGARLTLARNSPWETGNLNIAALLELAGGLLVLAVVLLAARWSSLGAIVTGVLVLVVGVPFVAVPRWTQETLEPVVTWLERLDDLGGNVAHHLVASGSTGRLVVTGLALMLVGVVSHGARRKGRREVRPVVETD